MQSVSDVMVALTGAVLPEGLKDDATLTSSPPTKPRPRRRRMILCASKAEKLPKQGTTNSLYCLLPLSGMTKSPQLSR